VCFLLVQCRKHIGTCLIDCPTAKHFWIASGICNEVEQQIYNASDINELIFSLLPQHDQHYQNKAIMVLWSIWKTRNEKLWEDIEISPTVSIAFTHQHVSEWSFAKSSSPNKQIP